MTTIPGDLPLGIQGYERKTPAHVWAMVLIGIVGAVLIFATR